MYCFFILTSITSKKHTHPAKNYRKSYQYALKEELDEPSVVANLRQFNSPLLPTENRIHVIRNQQVMLDSDLARLYRVETRVLNQAVKRNIERFPENFMFQLSKEESKNLISQIVTSSSRSQNVTLNLERGKNIKYLPYAFTENGVAMLSSVLRSKTAIEVNIRIMRAFTAMRSFLMSNAHMFKRLETIEHNYLLVNRHLSEHDRKNLKRCCRALTIRIPNRLRDFSLKGRYSMHICSYLI